MKGNRSILILVAWVCLLGFRWDNAPQKVWEGNRLFEKKEYGEALNRYREGETVRPNAPEISFNMGDSFYRQKAYDEAIASHKRTLELDKGPPPLTLRRASPKQSVGGPLQAKAHYNIGNSLYRKGDLQGALESYKKAVDLSPNDFDTKYNIEFLQKKLKEEKQKPKPQQSSEPQSQEQKEEESSGQEQKQEESQSEQPQELPREIPKKDADRILGALQAEERSLASPKTEGGKRPESDVEKDW